MFVKVSFFVDVDLTGCDGLSDADHRIGRKIVHDIEVYGPTELLNWEWHEVALEKK